MCDLLIKNGTLIDGTGSPGFLADLFVKDGKIEMIGPSLEIECQTILDASQKMVCPGFIDIHSHTDTIILINPKAESKIRQGITTEIVGNCGMSAAPLTPDFLSDLKDHLGVTSDFGNPEDIGKFWMTFGEYISYLNDLPLGINLMPMVGYGTLRCAVMGLKNRAPTPREMNAMEDLLQKSLEQGAAGLTTGLEYLPDSLSHTDELIRLCRVIACNNKLYASHIRGEAQTLFPAVAEAIRTAEASGCQVEISHLKLGGTFNWGKTEQLFALLENALSRGVRLSWDQYPYTAWETGLADYIPRWVREEGHQKLTTYLRGHSTRNKIFREIEAAIKTGNHMYNTAPWENVQISRVRSAEYKFAEGKRVSQIASDLDIDPLEFVFDLLIAEKGSVAILVFCMDDQDIITIMKHPLTIIASDGRAVATYGELHKGSPHPRYYGTFPRILGKYVREEKVVSLETAVQKMTSMPAKIMGLDDRGILACGMVADITIFDSKTVSDPASFENPHQYSKGIEHVIMAGHSIIHEGEHTNRMAGQVIE
jgi:N-acyl-D-amino-acid deacylase